MGPEFVDTCCVSRPGLWRSTGLVWACGRVPGGRVRGRGLMRNGKVAPFGCHRNSSILMVTSLRGGVWQRELGYPKVPQTFLATRPGDHPMQSLRALSERCFRSRDFVHLRPNLSSSLATSAPTPPISARPPSLQPRARAHLVISSSASARQPRGLVSVDLAPSSCTKGLRLGRAVRFPAGVLLVAPPALRLERRSARLGMHIVVCRWPNSTNLWSTCTNFGRQRPIRTILFDLLPTFGGQTQLWPTSSNFGKLWPSIA